MTPVTRYRQVAGGRDRYGNATYVWQASVLPQRCLLAPSSGEEAPLSSEPDSTLRSAIVTTGRAYFRGTFPDITADDELEIEGRRWQVVGHPTCWRPATWGTGGTTITLKEVQG